MSDAAVPLASPQPPEQAEKSPASRELAFLREFAKLPGCEAYTAATRQIDLLSTYIWLRQFTEGLTFELFLQKFASLADYNAENRKHPRDALAFYCPRAKKAADELGREQWTAVEIVDLLLLYVELLGFADAYNVPQDSIATIAQYLRAESEAFKRGETPRPKAPTKRKKRTSAGTPAPVSAVTGISPTGREDYPTEPGQQIVYRVPNQNRQVRGVVRRVTSEGDRKYVDFITPEGEVYLGRSILDCSLMEAEETDTPEPAASPLIIEAKRLALSTKATADVTKVLALNVPVGNVNLGDVIFPFNVSLDTKCADGASLGIDVTVVNGEQGPYVESELVNLDKNVVVDQLNPRENLFGEYRFDLPEGRVVLEVRARGDAPPPAQPALPPAP
jgi:hypothetical protein